MKQVYISYNPYKLTTQFLVEGKKPKEGSFFAGIATDTRLQEWIEVLPKFLVEEYNANEFDIKFHGTLLDYEDLAYVLKEAHENGLLNAKLDREPAKETYEKEQAIEEIFKKIQEGDFEELRSPDICRAFDLAKSSDFEVCVVATMSAGKSTLINSMLQNKLMPSKAEACTAIITRIKDETQENVPFQAETYYSDENLKDTTKNLTFDDMYRWNADPEVSEIRVRGNIPFVDSSEISLVLIDTPGPNNARDKRHGEIQRALLGKSSKALVVYVMTGEFGNNDDFSLLKSVSDSMKVGGKQSKDRFIFVVNKLDDRKEEDGSLQNTLHSIRKYLEGYGIKNPNVFPASALTAMNIRLNEKGLLTNEDEQDELEMKIKKLNRNADLHFEDFATLPPSFKSALQKEYEEATENWQGDDLKNPQTALIHTGIPSVEIAIRQYVDKYAKTAKIKNIVDTFIHKLEETGSFEELKKAMATNVTEKEKIIATIQEIESKIDSGKEAQDFRSGVDSAVKNTLQESLKEIETILTQQQKKVREQGGDFKGETFTEDEAELAIRNFNSFSEYLQQDMKSALEEIMTQNLTDTAKSLLNTYRAKLVALENEVSLDDSNLSISPLKIMNSNVVFSEVDLDDIMTYEERVVGKETYTKKVRVRGWFQGWAFWPKDEVQEFVRDKLVNVGVISGTELFNELTAPLQKPLIECANIGKEAVKKESEHLQEQYTKEFDKLDKMLKDKLAQLKSCATDKEKAEDRIADCERRLAWLEKIKTEVSNILEI